MVAVRSAGPDCVATHLTTPFDDLTALHIADAIGVLEGRWPGPQTLPIVDNRRLAAAADMMELCGLARLRHATWALPQEEFETLFARKAAGFR